MVHQILGAFALADPIEVFIRPVRHLRLIDVVERGPRQVVYMVRQCVLLRQMRQLGVAVQDLVLLRHYFCFYHLGYFLLLLLIPRLLHLPDLAEHVRHGKRAFLLK